MFTTPPGKSLVSNTLIKSPVISGFLRGNGNDVLPMEMAGMTKERNPAWRIRWANDTTVPMGSFIASATFRNGGFVDRAIELSAHARKKNPFNSQAHFLFRLFLSDDIGQAAGNFFVALRQVFAI